MSWECVVFLLKEAQNCRLQAAEYDGRPEANFLLNLADAFEQLASKKTARRKNLRDSGAANGKRLARRLLSSSRAVS